LFSNIDTLYENVKLRIRHLKGTVSAADNVDTSFGAQDVDERLFIEEKGLFKSETGKNNNNLNEFKISMPSNNLNLLLELNKFNLANIDSQHQKESSYNSQDFFEIDCAEIVDNFVIGKCSTLIKDGLVNALESFYQSKIDSEQTNDFLYQSTRLKSNLESKRTILFTIDYLIKVNIKLYLCVMEQMLSNEKKRIGLAAGEHFKQNFGGLLKKEAFHASLLACCFDMLYTFCDITLPNKKIFKLHSFLFEDSKSVSLNFKFPWCINLLELRSFDFLRIIEMFIKTTTSNTTTSTLNKIGNEFNLLNRDMIKYLNKCEEKIVESLAWQVDSTLWAHLKLLELNSPGDSSNKSQTQLDVAFPLFEDVIGSTPIVASNQHFPHPKIATLQTNSGLTLSPTTTSNTDSLQCSSPVKQTPTITRVVSGSDSPVKQSASQTTSSQVQLSQSSMPNKPAVPRRLKNMSSFVAYFFRKFYNLANIRLRSLIEKLDLAQISVDIHNQSKINSTLNKTAPNIDLVSSTPIMTTAGASASIIPPSPISTSQVITNTNNQHTLLLNEHYQLALKKIWNIFEYAICFQQQQENLMLERHLDQLLMCSIYAACKISNMPIKFQDIMKHYRTNDNNLIYRSVLLHDSSHRADLITFYNQIFLKKLKTFIISQNSSPSPSPNPSHLFVCPSPVPKLANHLFSSTQFSPCKISNPNSCVYVMPSKSNYINTASSQLSLLQSSMNSQAAANSLQLTLPTTQLRNKLSFSINDKNPLKSLELINEMIRKNELKIKSSNKRLFSDISLHNSLPTSNHIISQAATNATNKTNPTTIPQRQRLTIKSFTKSNSEMFDENDGSSNNKIPCIKSLNRSLTSTNFLNKIVTTKLGSTPKSNLVTMVVSNNNNNDNSSGLPSKGLSTSLNSNLQVLVASTTTIGSNFARKLQDIQSERTNFK
jgi:hypothetical protein